LCDFSCTWDGKDATGKVAITFVQSYLEVFPHCSPVIIAPRGMLATWEKEFRKWKVKLPFHVLNSTEINWSEDKTLQEQAAKNGTFHRRLLTDKMDQNYRRLVKLGSWMNGTSIIGLSYSLFRKLANHEGMDGDKVRKLLLEKPNLLVLDEGHTPRNKKSLIWKVLKRVHTEKRIILSGTLFQNNFEELYNTLRLVRPKDADALHLETDESKDFWSSLRLNDITKANINEVRKKLDPIVHIHSGRFLQKSLPGLRESVVILNPLLYQKEVIASMEKTVAMGLDAEYKISLASIHPSLLASAKLSMKEESILDKPKLESLRSNPSGGVKTRFVLEIVRLCEALNERVLVFSQYLEPLSLIMEQLKERFSWAEGEEILLMSGKVLVKKRQTMMEVFNNMKSKAKVMLASTKACCEGITLVGASRVVLLDVVWNPSVGRQAIGRAYRIGQRKIVYTYNLIAEGTTEKRKYDRQAKKEHMSKLLFSNELERGGCNLPPELTFNDRVLEELTAREDLKNLFVKIYVDNQTDGSRGK
jgi:DNA repair and recombination protein RAD54 and RAD54-like protein